MAPRGKKRASIAPASLLPLPLQNALAVAASPPKEPPVKKYRIDAIFESIVATLQGVDDLNEHCREMLVAFVAPSLSTPKSDRHDVQQLGVRMIGETLKDHQNKLIVAVTTSQKELSELEGSKSDLLQRFADAKTLLEKRQEAKTAADVTHMTAKTAAESSACAVSEAQVMKKKGDDAMAVLEKAKADLKAVYLEHFKTPMDADEGPHHAFLKPFMENLGLEESLINALPSSCVKTKEQRGGFDDLVLAQLDKALLEKIAALETGLSDEALADTERKNVVLLAQQDLEGKRLAETAAAGNLETATSAQSEADEDVDKASKEWATFEPRVKEAADKLSVHEARRSDFEEGPLKTFHTLQEKEAATLIEEAATAGA